MKLEKIPTERLMWSIFIIGILLYARTLLNGFVGDDLGYINHPYIKNFELLKLFKSSSADLGGSALINGQFYRPLMLAGITLIYKIFGGAAFFYHLFQILLHITNVYLLFILLRKFFSRIPSYIASLIFLVHPINTETVVYISNLQDVLFVFFGLLSLTIYSHAKLTLTKYVAIPAFLLASCLSKETGLLFLIIFPLYLIKFKAKKIYYVLPIISLTAYLFLRVGVAHLAGGKVGHTVFSSLTLIERISNIPYLIFYYVRTLVFPLDLAIGQTWVVKTSVISYLLLLALVVLLIFFSVTLLKSKGKAVRIFFLTWFILGIVIHLQLLPLEMTVADRWFYFPFIGFLGIIILLLEGLRKRTLNKVYLIILLIIPFLFVRTFLRIGDFKDSLTLYSHDSKITQSHIVEGAYAYELMERNQLQEAYPHALRSVKIFPTTNNLNTLGVWYFKSKDYKKASSYFEKSLSYGDNFLAYNNLSRLYLLKHDYVGAAKILENGLKKYPSSDTFWFLLTVSYYKTNHKQEALQAAFNAFSIQQNQRNFYIYSTLKSGKELIIRD